MNSTNRLNFENNYSNQNSYNNTNMLTQPIGRINRFTALAETSFKSPTDLRYSLASKSPNDDGSRKRRLSHSPVSVNTNYEISEHNTDKLWENF